MLAKKIWKYDHDLILGVFRRQRKSCQIEVVFRVQVRIFVRGKVAAGNRDPSHGVPNSYLLESLQGEQKHWRKNLLDCQNMRAKEHPSFARWDFANWCRLSLWTHRQSQKSFASWLQCPRSLSVKSVLKTRKLSFPFKEFERQFYVCICTTVQIMPKNRIG